jgi:hypothetical protein
VSYQLGNAKVWDGTQWVPAVGGGVSQPWYTTIPSTPVDDPPFVTVTADAAANTKGAWAEVISSTSGDVTALFVIVRGIQQSTVNTATLLDFAIGASGSETPIAENIAVGGAVQGTAFDLSGLFAVVPCDAPAGSRISARIQSVVSGGKTAQIDVRAFAAGSPVSSVDVLGPNTANSQGASFSGIAGTWTQIIASTSRDYAAIGFVPSAHNAAIVSFRGVYTIGVGASGSEAPISTIEVFNWNQEGVSNNFSSGFLPLAAANIPAGSRLAVQHNIAANPERYGITLIGVPA